MPIVKKETFHDLLQNRSKLVNEFNKLKNDLYGELVKLNQYSAEARAWLDEQAASSKSSTLFTSKNQVD